MEKDRENKISNNNTALSDAAFDLFKKLDFVELFTGPAYKRNNTYTYGKCTITIQIEEYSADKQVTMGGHSRIPGPDQLASIRNKDLTPK